MPPTSASRRERERNQRVLSQGAEAKIILKGKKVVKDRISKSYRIKQLDDKIKKSRTKSETKLLNKVTKIISSPKPEKQENDFQINMPFIDGKKLSDHLDKLKNQKQIMNRVGVSTAKLHKEGIIHGDLTTSNMILKDDEVFFIDFGLGYSNGKYEDKAVDIHLLKQALEAKHFKNWQELYEEFLKGYKEIDSEEAEKVLDRLHIVEKRGRYKH